MTDFKNVFALIFHVIQEVRVIILFKSVNIRVKKILHCHLIISQFNSSAFKIETVMIRVFGDDWNSFATTSIKNLGDIIRELIRFVIIVVELKIAVVETLGILQIIDMIFDSEHNITHIQVFNYYKQKIYHPQKCTTLSPSLST